MALTKQLTAEQLANQQRAAVFVLSHKATAKGALFQHTPADGGHGEGVHPAMTGVIDFEVDGVKTSMPVSGFVKYAKESDDSYLSLSMGVEGGVHYYGSLFNKVAKKAEMAVTDPAKAEKMRDYSGVLRVLPVWPKGHPKHVTLGVDDYEAADELMVFGTNKQAATSDVVYVELSIAPKRNPAAGAVTLTGKPFGF
jgi:hypothetical protein